MDSSKAVFTLEVNLDPVPGAMHTVRDAQYQIQNILDRAIGHYEPLILTK